MAKKCKWVLDHEDLRWHSGCGFECELPDDSIKGSDWEFCPFCGSEIEESDWIDIDDGYGDYLYEVRKDRELFG